MATPPHALPHGSEAQIAIIESFGDLPFDNDKADRLAVAAGSHNLTPAAQLVLIDEAMGLGFDKNKTRVLVALAGNPCLSPPARAALARRINNGLAFASHRKRVLDTLARNAGASPPADLHAVPLPVVDQIALIDAYAALPSTSKRVRGLSSLARRPDLDAPSQHRLIDVTFDRVSSTSGQHDILTALASNPTIGTATIAYLVENLGRLSSSHSRDAVLQALVDRPPASPAGYGEDEVYLEPLP
ncbi:MAG: hypothetical protein AAFX76_07455 [Planctomycetota bacterium]